MVDRLRIPLYERFWAKVSTTPDDGCWEWVGSVTDRGYGKIMTVSRNGQKEYAYAHRLSYEMHVGAIPEGLQLDHLCRNRRGVNPVHLEAVTCGENLARGRAANRTAAN